MHGISIVDCAERVARCTQQWKQQEERGNKKEEANILVSFGAKLFPELGIAVASQCPLLCLVDCRMAELRSSPFEGLNLDANSFLEANEGPAGRLPMLNHQRARLSSIVAHASAQTVISPPSFSSPPPPLHAAASQVKPHTHTHLTVWLVVARRVLLERVAPVAQEADILSRELIRDLHKRTPILPRLRQLVVLLIHMHGVEVLRVCRRACMRLALRSPSTGMGSVAKQTHTTRQAQPVY